MPQKSKLVGVLALFCILVLQFARADPVGQHKRSPEEINNPFQGATVITEAFSIYFHQDHTACIETESMQSCQAEWGVEGEVVWVFDPSLHRTHRPFLFKKDQLNERKLLVSFRPFQSWAANVTYELRQADALGIKARAPVRQAVNPKELAIWNYEQIKREILAAARATREYIVRSPVSAETAARHIEGRTLILGADQEVFDVFYFSPSGEVCGLIQGQESCHFRWRRASPSALELFHVGEVQDEVIDMKFSLVEIGGGDMAVYVWLGDGKLHLVNAKIYPGNPAALNLASIRTWKSNAPILPAQNKVLLRRDQLAGLNLAASMIRLFSALAQGAQASNDRDDEMEMICESCPRTTDDDKVVYSRCHCRIVRRNCMVC
jgi:hypothetical protein